MTDHIAELLLAVPLVALAARLWLRARRAEARLAAGDRRHHELVTDAVRLAERDPLTGLCNRRAFDDALAELTSAAEPGALILVDLDNFKQVNDRLGHQRGDEVLRDVAHAIMQRVRETDLVARIGGDEFAIVLPGADPDHAQAVAVDLRDEVRAACRQLPLRVPVDASVGVAWLASGSDDAGEVVARADAAMYRVKRARHDHGLRRRFSASDQLELSSS
jgi:diguanylate cyclase (GGDEF)-like protein